MARIKINVKEHKPSDYLGRQFTTGGEIYSVYATDDNTIHFERHKTGERNFVGFSLFSHFLARKIWEMCDED